jgi:hypothetical protein
LFYSAHAHNRVFHDTFDLMRVLEVSMQHSAALLYFQCEQQASAAMSIDLVSVPTVATICE